MRRLSSRQVAASSMSDRLALPQGTYRVPYRYRGHLSHKKSLIGIFRQVTVIKRDKILRFAEKFGKKIFATSFFRTEICLCLSEIKKSPSVKFLRAAGQFMSKLAHVTCLDQWESRESISDKIGSGHACAVYRFYMALHASMKLKLRCTVNILNWIMQLFANGYLSNFGVLMKNIWGIKCTCSFVSSKGGLFSDQV